MEEIVLKTGERLHPAPSQTLGGTDGAALTVSYDATEPVGNEIAVMTLDFGTEPFDVRAKIEPAAGTRFSLNWGDGTIIERSPEGQTVIETHAYVQAGVYSVTLISEREDGRTSRSTITANLEERIVFENRGGNELGS